MSVAAQPRHRSGFLPQIDRYYHAIDRSAACTPLVRGIPGDRSFAPNSYPSRRRNSDPMANSDPNEDDREMDPPKEEDDGEVELPEDEESEIDVPTDEETDDGDG